MLDAPKPIFRLPPWAAGALALAMGVGLAVLDFFTPANIHLPIIYAVPVVLCAWIRSRRFLWTLALGFVGLTYVDWIFGPGPMGHDYASRELVTGLNRTLAALGIITTAMVVHLWLSVRDMLEFNDIILRQRNAEYEATNEALAAQDKEIVRERDALLERVEELQRQCDDLKATLAQDSVPAADPLAPPQR